MGMFDYVTGPKILCTCCKRPISNWQSKDGECDLKNIDFRSVNNFYSSCVCGAWIEVNFRTKPPQDRTLEDYEIITQVPLIKDNTYGKP